MPISIKIIDLSIFHDDEATNYNEKNLDAIIILSGMLKVVKKMMQITMNGERQVTDFSKVWTLQKNFQIYHLYLLRDYCLGVI